MRKVKDEEELEAKLEQERLVSRRVRQEEQASSRVRRRCSEVILQEAYSRQAQGASGGRTIRSRVEAILEDGRCRAPAHLSMLSRAMRSRATRPQATRARPPAGSLAPLPLSSAAAYSPRDALSTSMVLTDSPNMTAEI